MISSMCSTAAARSRFTSGTRPAGPSQARADVVAKMRAHYAKWWARVERSLGEFTAYHAAGALGLAEALTLVRRRGELMYETGNSRPGAMAINACLVWFFDTYLKGEAPPFPTNPEIYNVQIK